MPFPHPFLLPKHNFILKFSTSSGSQFILLSLLLSGQDSSHSSLAPAWGPSHSKQSFTNFSIMSPSLRLQFFMNCYRAPSLWNRWLQCDFPTRWQGGFPVASHMSHPCSTSPATKTLPQKKPVTWLHWACLWNQVKSCKTSLYSLKWSSFNFQVLHAKETH